MINEKQVVILARYLGIVGALAAEADYVFFPECPPPADWPVKLCKKLEQACSIEIFQIVLFRILLVYTQTFLFYCSNLLYFSTILTWELKINEYIWPLCCC